MSEAFKPETKREDCEYSDHVRGLLEPAGPGVSLSARDRGLSLAGMMELSCFCLQYGNGDQLLLMIGCSKLT